MRYSGHERNEDAELRRISLPPEIIAHTVWLYFRCALSYRDVEELLAEREVPLTYETVRQWCRKFGQRYANGTVKLGDFGVQDAAREISFSQDLT